MRGGSPFDDRQQKVAGEGDDQRQVHPAGVLFVSYSILKPFHTHYLTTEIRVSRFKFTADLMPLSAVFSAVSSVK